VADRDLIMTLSKLIIAAAWADGEITAEETNNLKLLLLRLRSAGQSRGIELSGQDWARLDMYIETPVDSAERARLLVELQERLRTSQQKRLAIESIRDVIAADGKVTAEEEAVLAEVKTALDQVNVGVLGALERLVGNQVQSRRAAVRQAPNREYFFDDFLRNKVYYALARHPRRQEVAWTLTEDEQRKLALAGGLMAKIAHIDGELSEGEFETMVQTLQGYWALDEAAAAFVVEVALAAINETYDVTRIRQELTAATSKDERRQFLRALFAVAAADGEISMDEHEEIRVIARGIKLTHKDFINAKLQVLSEGGGRAGV
jgi:uncharacterized tellurite resistance protein B-like protein